MNLLHIDSSITGEASASRAITAAVVARLTTEHPDLAVTYRDLAAAPIGHLSLADLAAADTQAIVAEFLAADVVVIGAGFYNFTIGSQLKAWIDRIVIPGATFRYGENGIEGLAGDKRVIVALARGGVYAPGTPMAAFEHAETYLRAVFGMLGVTALDVIVAEGLKMSDEHRAAALDAALAEAGTLRIAA
jgi:FMN-dependent NADH-azoreductase